jgi:hypothetical protein
MPIHIWFAEIRHASFLGRKNAETATSEFSIGGNE